MQKRRLSLPLSLLPLAALLLAAGCSKEKAAAAPAPAEVEVAAAQTPAVPCEDDGYTPLPEGVTLDHAFHVRTDRVYLTRNDTERRRTSLELMSGEPRQVAEAALATLISQGARQIEVPDKGDGVVRFAVRKAGVGRINISATQDRGKKPSHPRSVGVIAFDWPVAVSERTTGG